MVIPNTRSASWAVPGLIKTHVQGDVIEKLSASDIIYKICSYFDISEDMLFKKNRKRDIVYPRQIGAYLMCRHTNLTLKDIASFLCLKDHTTVIHNRDKIADLITLPHEESVRMDIYKILNVWNTVGEMRTDLVGKILRRNGRAIKVLCLADSKTYECQDLNKPIIFKVDRLEYDSLYLYRGTKKHTG